MYKWKCPECHGYGYSEEKLILKLCPCCIVEMHLFKDLREIINGKRVETDK